MNSAFFLILMAVESILEKKRTKDAVCYVCAALVLGFDVLCALPAVYRQTMRETLGAARREQAAILNVSVHQTLLYPSFISFCLSKYNARREKEGAAPRLESTQTQKSLLLMC